MNIVKIDLTPVPEISVESEADILVFRAQLEVAAKKIREARDAHDAAIIKYFRENNIREISLSDTAKMYIAKDDKDRFDSEAIKAALEFTPEQLAVLPLNPAWKKTAVLANPKTAIAHFIEPGEKVVVKELDKKFIKGSK
ncbi:MAG: hypothetical protein WC734_06010 [Patescibacteria group bacterium]|jgi:hypothetical protein